eukprot:CAMPEP_0204107756 /NCGR_PEP_ID=MMETSP0361-20130328/311_1 /ASSEMBLY_ACC=CAM_ASM_000343 /TAXON_ID=268821 /ORGANISM="Scrippsiella Hangoei, Strain SHTV-5" /LENGTH=32 /DNA_ID= /DNA_START= /DNA_END= /DNA_ORIENTATION=
MALKQGGGNTEWHADMSAVMDTCLNMGSGVSA